jgi:hypothetical protein
MTFEIVALSDRPNALGLTGVILFNERTGYVEAGKHRPTIKPGDFVTIRSGSSQFFGLNWGAEGFEAAMPVRKRIPYNEPKHVPTHYLCVHMFRALPDDREALSMFRIEATRRDEIPAQVEQHAALFGTTYDRYEIKDLGVI